MNMMARHTTPIVSASFAASCALGALFLAGCGSDAGALVKTGNRLADEGKHEEAILNFQKAIQSEGNNADARLGLGLSFVQTGKWREASDALAEAVRLDPNLEAARHALAELDLKILKSDPQRPKRFYDDLGSQAAYLRSKGKEPSEGWRFEGELRLLDGEAKAALEAFQKATSLPNAKIESFHGVVRAKLALGDLPGAEAAAQALIRQNPAFGQAYDELYAIYGRSNRIDLAEKVFQQKVSNNPGNSAFLQQLAAHYWNLRKPQEMEATLKILREDAKRFPEGAVEAAQFYSRVGMWAKALEIYESLIQSNSPLKQKARKLSLQPYLAMNDKAGALKVIETAIREEPSDAEAKFLRATLLADGDSAEQLRQAVREFEQVREQRKTDPAFHYARGQAYMKLTDLTSAESAFQEAVQVGPGLKQAYLALAELYLLKGERAKALAYAESVYRADPNGVSAKLLRIKTLAANGRGPEGRADLDAMAKEYPGNEDVQLELAAALLQEARLADAETILSKLRDSGNLGSRRRELSVRLRLAQGQTMKAFELAKAEWERDKNSSSAMRLMAECAEASGQFRAAADAYSTLIQKEPNDALLHYQLARIQQMMGNTPAALESLKRSAELQPQNPIPVSLRAFILQEAGRADEAEAAWRKVISMRPGDPSPINNLAYLLAESGKKLEEALSLARQGVDRSGGSGNSLDTLGWVLFKKKDFAGAAQQFRLAAQKDAKNPVFHYHLGLALGESGAKEEARKALVRALECQPSQADAERIRAAQKRFI
jgi:Flp pilus assembly protein TadD